jgi:hypothetical protein
MFAGTVTRQSAREMLVEALVNRIRLSGGMVWTGRGVSPPARRRTSPRRGSGGSRVSLVGRRCGLRAVPQTAPARSLLQMSRWSSMELALAGRGQVSVGDCSVIGWTRMFGTGGARRMLSRMFGGVDAGLSLGDLSGGARAFQPGHAAKFAQGPRGAGQTGRGSVAPTVSPFCRRPRTHRHGAGRDPA